MGTNPVVIALALSAFSAGTVMAQQPVQPLPKVGGCPLGYYVSGDYCVPTKSGNTRGAIEKSSNSCPLGFYSSGNYCVSSPSNNREAIQKQGNSCPLGWFSSGSYCVKNN
jgi:hypothetical protein